MRRWPAVLRDAVHPGEQPQGGHPAVLPGRAAARSRSGQARSEFRELLGRFMDICDAISYAHSRGVLHRDLKPGNIMLGPYGETLVVDWGLAKTIEQSGAERPLEVAGVAVAPAGGEPPGAHRGRLGGGYARLHEP